MLSAILSRNSSFNSSASSASSDYSTFSQPRTPSPFSMGTSSPKLGSDKHPDLSSEVANLSTKLINAINHNTALDDELQSSKQELETLRNRIANSDRQVKQYKDAVNTGVFVKRADVVGIEEGLRDELSNERKRRGSAERAKKGMEQELETLTTSLFEEANTMVAAARHETEKVEKRADSLRAMLSERDKLLASQQEQLRDLKELMQQLMVEPNENMSTGPSTPILTATERGAMIAEPLSRSANQSRSDLHVPPASPLHFSHLIQPIIRTDIHAYDEFVSLLRTNRPNGQSGRGGFAGLNVLGLGNKDMSSQSTVVPAQSSGPSNSSQTRSGSVAQHSPNISGESASSQLKDTKFYKRIQSEDIEPTLRLDGAPGLSWLAKRNILSAIASGNLIVEPVVRSRIPAPNYPCALCGEVRNEDTYARRHRFRTSDSDEAQRYPLCDYCLTRVRTTGEFTNFLRLARSGHCKNETADECRTAWEESVRLREQMFWSRVGGGVLPVGANGASGATGGQPLTMNSPGAPMSPRTNLSPIARTSTAGSEFEVGSHRRAIASRELRRMASEPGNGKTSLLDMSRPGANSIAIETSDADTSRPGASLRSPASESRIRNLQDQLEAQVVTNMRQNTQPSDEQDAANNDGVGNSQFSWKRKPVGSPAKSPVPDANEDAESELAPSPEKAEESQTVDEVVSPTRKSRNPDQQSLMLNERPGSPTKPTSTANQPDAETEASAHTRDRSTSSVTAGVKRNRPSTPPPPASRDSTNNTSTSPVRSTVSSEATNPARNSTPPLVRPLSAPRPLSASKTTRPQSAAQPRDTTNPYPSTASHSKSLSQGHVGTQSRSRPDSLTSSGAVTKEKPTLVSGLASRFQADLPPSSPLSPTSSAHSAHPSMSSSTAGTTGGSEAADRDNRDSRDYFNVKRISEPQPQQSPPRPTSSTSVSSARGRGQSTPTTGAPVGTSKGSGAPSPERERPAGIGAVKIPGAFS